MADGQEEQGGDKTEEPTPERREELRESGQIAISKEIPSTLVMVLFASVGFFQLKSIFIDVQKLIQRNFLMIANFELSSRNFFDVSKYFWMQTLHLIIPLLVMVIGVTTLATLLQTQFNWSWKKIVPDFKRVNPLDGIKKLIGMQGIVEGIKSSLKMAVIGAFAFGLIWGEKHKIISLLFVEPIDALKLIGSELQYLTWAVSGVLLLIAGGDFFYQWMSFEKKQKMTKQEVKEEAKKREVDPHVKGRLRRMQRDLVSRRMLDKAKKATVIVTNPTHYAVALMYEVGMRAPVVVAKGIDFLALRIREQSEKLNIPIVENKPLARELYAKVDVDQEISEGFYKAVSEVIKYVFSLKNIRIPKKK